MTEEDNKPKSKFRGGDKNINRAGRKPGSKNKNTIPKPNEIEDEIQRHGLKAIKKIVKQMDDVNCSPAIQQKNAFWLAEKYMEIEELRRVAKKADEKDKEESKPSSNDKPRAAVLSLKAVDK